MRPGHDAAASREPARSYARDLGAHSECSSETARQLLACMGVCRSLKIAGPQKSLNCGLKHRSLFLPETVKRDPFLLGGASPFQGIKKGVWA